MPDRSLQQPVGRGLDAAAEHALRTGWEQLAQGRGFTEAEARRLAFWRWRARSRAETAHRIFRPPVPELTIDR